MMMILMDGVIENFKDNLLIEINLSNAFQI
jgi:hypothetical protein